MNFQKKIIGFTSLFLVLFTTFLPLTWAQSSLDAIKNKLEGAGIELIDYSADEDKWGGLSEEWIEFLKEEGYESLPKLAVEFKGYFEDEGSLTDLKNQIARAQAELSRLNIFSERKEKTEQIKALKEAYLEGESELLKEINTLITPLFLKAKPMDNPLSVNVGALQVNALIDSIELSKKEIIAIDWESEFGVNPDKPLLSQKKSAAEAELRRLEADYERADLGVQLLFNKINFYYNYNKWGPLPSRIVDILSVHYSGLQEMSEAIDASSQESSKTDFDILRENLSGYGGLSKDDLELVINAVQFYIAGGSGEAQINQVGLVVARNVQNVAGAIAILWIVIAGVRLIFSEGDEATITEQKNSILYGVIGLVVILLMGRLVEVLYGAPGVNRTSLVADEGFSNEVYGIVAFLKALVGTVAIFFIILSAVRMLFAQGDEAEITKERTSILWVGMGLVLIAINEVIVKNIFVIPAAQSDQIKTSNIANIINTFGNVMKFILGFVGVITLGILVYGAATMILNFGDEEMVNKSKAIIKNAIIGILVILSAYVIVASLVVFD